jgi:exopolysaccharide biosynthesis WecB/TagA/CpsF family protein
LGTRFDDAAAENGGCDSSLGSATDRHIVPAIPDTIECHFFELHSRSNMSNILEIDDYDLTRALEAVANFGTDRFGYVVTPNVDHVIRHFYEAGFRGIYAQATYVLLDSRFLAHTIWVVKRQVLRVCAGSDLTPAVIRTVIQPRDVVVLVGGTQVQTDALRKEFGLRALHYIDPPMNFIRDPAAVESCLAAIEACSPFRFCFLAIGSPQQEIIAQKLKERGIARGLALCVGTAINYMTRTERRAPSWMQRTGFEWLFRLLQNPRRLAKRYLVRGPLIFLLLWRIEIRLRRTEVGTPNIKAISGVPP